MEDIMGINGALTLILLIIPFLIFIFLLAWGSKKGSRKKPVIEISYNLIAIELLLMLLLPVCYLPAGCLMWSSLPLLMFLGLSLFVYHRMSQDAQHKMRIMKAAEDGHVKPEGPEPLVEEPVPEPRKQVSEKPQTLVKLEWDGPEDVEEKPRMPSASIGEKDHKNIEKMIDKVLSPPKKPKKSKKKSKKSKN